MQKIKKILSNLKELGAIGVKQSLEDEGASFQEIRIMRKITRSLGMKLNVKIGGCEAKNDVFFNFGIKSDSIVAPMVESSYALKKFIQIANKKKGPKLFFNLETINAANNFDKIIKSEDFKYLSGIVVGRSDLAGSMNLEKKHVNNDKIFKIVKKCFKKVKNRRKKKICKMGGSITPDSKDFVNKLFSSQLLDNIETRNIEIKLSKKNIQNIDKIITKSLEFEVEWLKYKLNKFKIEKFFKNDYRKRIAEINIRLKKVENFN